MFPIIVLRTGVLFGFIRMVDQFVSTRRPSTTVDNGLLTQGLYRDAFLHFIHRDEHYILDHAYIARAGGGTAPYTTLALATGGSFEFVYIINE